MMYEELYWIGLTIFMEELERSNDRNEAMEPVKMLWWLRSLTRLIKIMRARGESK